MGRARKWLTQPFEIPLYGVFLGLAICIEDLWHLVP